MGNSYPTNQALFIYWSECKVKIWIIENLTAIIILENSLKIGTLKSYFSLY